MSFLHRSNMPLFFVFTLSCCIPAASLAADGPSLVRHTNTSGRYEALMPAGAEDKTVTGKSLVDTQYRSRVVASGAVFEVRAQVISPISLDDEELNAALRDRYIGQARTQFVKAFGDPVAEREVSQHTAIGKDFRFRLRDSQQRPLEVRQRVMFDGQRIFSGLVQGAPVTVNSDAADRFLDSIGPLGKVTIPKKTAEVKPPNAPQNSNGVTSDTSTDRAVSGVVLRRHTDSDFDFVVDMPPIGQKDIQPDHQSLIAVAGTTTVFGIGSMRMGDKLKSELRIESLSHPSKALKDFVVRKTGLTPKKIRQTGLAGFEVDGDVKTFKGHTRMRVFLNERGLHMLFVLGPDEMRNSKAADQFLDSFKLTGEPRTSTYAPNRGSLVQYRNN